MSNTQTFNIGPGLLPADVTNIKNHIDAIMLILAPHLVNLTPAQTKKLRKLGKRIGYVQEMQALATAQGATFLPASFNMAQFNTVVGYLTNLGVIEAHQTTCTEGVKHTLVYYGNIAMEISDHVYELGKVEAASGNTAVGAYIERAKRVFEGQGQKGHTQDFAIEGGATLTVSNVSQHAPFHNLGSTILLVQKANAGTAAPSTQRSTATAVITVQPGTHIKLPESFTAISVTNQSTSVAGMFSVKVRGAKK